MKRPDLANAYEEESEIATKLRLALVNGPFPGMGVGDADVYKAFCWRFWNLICAQDGRLGVVLPRSAWSVKGSQDFRITAFGRSCNEIAFLVNNKQWVFPDVHPQYTIALTSLWKTDHSKSPQVSIKGPFRNYDAFCAGKSRPAVVFSAKDVLNWTDTAALPLLPAEDSAVVFSQLRKSPRLDLNEPSEWRARPLAEEIHSRKEQHLMRKGDGKDGDWPVYKGESFEIWNPDTGVYYGWADPDEGAAYLQRKRVNGSARNNSPFFEFRDRPGYLNKVETLPCMTPRILIRRVTNRTNQRTVLVALAPAKVFVADQASCLLWPRGDEKDVAFLLGILSSLPLDWYARRFVETDVRLHIINPLPIPRPTRDNSLWQRVVAIAGRLASPDKRFSKWAKVVGVECGKLDANEKDDMICELDGVVANLYGLTESQLVHLFETFHEGWDYQPRLIAVLKHYKAWTGKF